MTAALDSAVPALRAFARTEAARWGLTGVLDGLALVVSELVGNSVRHSGSSDVRLLLRAGAHALTVEVADTGQWRRPADRRGGLARGGRGLQLVEAFSSSVTVHTGRWGTRVIAVLPRG
ncbi:ATP-binding protein [Kitasatospora sp. NPDC051853]|uniref:ATP-binding protein n=1 Tax=Kitasatospora sp. NPDC051853 TaxID=3364058 RepID=UPI0037B15D4B